LNAAYLVVVIPLMHRRLIRHSMGQWYLGDIGLPGGLCLGIGALTYLVAPRDVPPLASFLWILVAYAATFLCTALAMPHTRAWLKSLVFAAGDAKVKS
ncbi:MAG TPA: hypothetical protein VFO57_04760, partial [Burkholderiales bacterium]|nr:hypothetical protein [Burkholderiales bacterium]